MVNLPPDIIIDILTRLRVKDLLRYRCVAKPWCSLIDSPEFIQKHLDCAMKTASSLGVVIAEEELRWMQLESPQTTTKLENPIKDNCGPSILGSCNGLLALLNVNDEVAIWNPTTKRFRKLPNSEIEFPPGILPCVQYMVYGFGYDRVADDYKVVRMIQFYGSGDDDFDSEVKVYSAKTDTWKRIHDFPYYLSYKRVSGVLVNNALHWVVSRSYESEIVKFIVAFDLEKEEYYEVLIPIFDLDIHLNVSVLGGLLCLICNFLNTDPNHDWDSQSNGVDIWVLKEYGVKESWTKLFSVVPNEQIGTFSYILPVANRSEDQILLDKNGKKFITYDLNGERAEDADLYSTSFHMEWLLCVESLVGLDSREENNGWKMGVEGKKKKKKKKKMKKNNKLKRDDFQEDRTMVANLPPEIIANILTRLRVKDLLRYRSVSKLWCSMIDGPDFIMQHLKTASHLGVVIKDIPLCWMDLDFPNAVSGQIENPVDDQFWTKLVGSCNGLIALSNSYEDAAILNPATRRFHKLPSSEIYYIEPEFTVYGFGYDCIADDYKLVKLVCLDSDSDSEVYKTQVHVYTAKTDNWKRICNFPYYLHHGHEHGVLANNMLHWIATRMPESDEGMLIVAFDLEKEEYFEIPFLLFEKPRIRFNIQVFDGSLCVVCNFFSDDYFNDDWSSRSKGVDVWAMKEYGVKESWTKLFSFVPNEQIGRFNHILPVAKLSDDRVLLDKNGKKFIKCDLKGEMAEDREFYSTSHMDWLVCVESLVGLGRSEGRKGWKTRMESKKKKEEKKTTKTNIKQKRDDFLSKGFKLML